MKKIIISIIFIIVLVVILTPSLVSAIKLKDPTGAGTVSEATVTDLIGKVASVIVGTAGSFGLLMFTYGGFMMLSSAGNTERLNQGKQILIWAVIGILAIMLSYLVIRLIIQAFSGGTIN